MDAKEQSILVRNQEKIKEAYTNLSKSYMNDEDFKQGIKYYFSDDPETL